MRFKYFICIEMLLDLDVVELLIIEVFKFRYFSI